MGVVNGLSIEKLLEKIPLRKIWGIGPNTSAYLEKLGLKTALDFAQKDEEFIRKNLTKPFFEIWKELHGEMVYSLDLEPKNSYRSIVRSQTFAPATNDKDFLWARLLNHVEEAFSKARSLNYQVGRMSILLKTQNFRLFHKEIRFLEPVSYPLLIREQLKKALEEIYQKNFLYRTTGCSIYQLSDKKISQPSLFDQRNYKEEKIKKIYPLLEEKKVNFGTKLFDKQSIANDKRPKAFKIPMLSI